MNKGLLDYYTKRIAEEIKEEGKNQPGVNLENGEGEVSLKQIAWEEEAENTASGKGAVALGGYNRANAKCAMAVNYDNEVNAEKAFACGSNNTILEAAEGSFVAGHSNTAKSTYQTIVGAYGVVDDNDSLVVGNGSSEADRRNAFKVDKDGNVTATGNIKAVKANVDGLNARNISVTNNITANNKITGNEIESKGNITGNKINADGLNIRNISASNNVTVGNKIYSNSFIAGTHNHISELPKEAIVAGYQNKIARDRQFVFGVYANPTNDDMFVVGTGSSDSARQNAFVVKRTGDVCIGKGNSLTIGETEMTEEILKNIGDVRSALDELHAYAQALINGGVE